jgi:protein TonB
VTENRFLQSFSALLASAILVCGTHLLLIASSDYGRPESGQQLAPVATPAPSVAPAAQREAIEVEVTGATLDRSHSDATPFAGDQTPASAPAPAETVSSEPAPEPASEPVEKAEAKAPSSETVPSPAIEEDKVASAAETVTPAVEATTPVVEPSETPKPAEPSQTAETDTQAASEPKVAEAAPSATPEAVKPTVEANEAPKPAEPTQTADAESAPAKSQVPEQAIPVTPETISPSPHVAEAETPAAPAPVVAEPEQPSEPKVAEANSTTQSNETAEFEPTPPSVPLPARKPVPAANVKTAKATAKQVAPAAKTEVQEAAAESKPRWTPMALAPADKDLVGKPKVAPKRTEGAGSYNAKIWSALARHKPRTGKAGSAAVTFSIGPGGGLRSARISGSSGDSQLDQMALQTVRNAAPFPPPPDPASSSYTIRIYFR